MENTKNCNTCYIEKLLTEFDCYGGKYRGYCTLCRKQKDRIKAEQRRREKGINPVKNTEAKCVDCELSFLKMVKHSVRCKSCAHEKHLQRARDASLDKARERGNRIMGSEQSCEHCSKLFTLDRPKAKYCQDCRVLQKKNALPFMKENHKKYLKKYMQIQENKNKSLKKSYLYRKKRRKNDPLFTLIGRIRSRLNESLRKDGYTKRSRTNEIIGCSWEFLKGYIESQFVDGMNWENRSEWHIDHIIPISSAKTEEDVIKLSHYTNLRPLWAADNLRKSNKLETLL